MDKKSLLSKIIGRKEIVDYSYAILFFLISSFFLIFAVRPALSIAFSLKRESADLKRINDIYERNILKLVDIQANLESIRDKLSLLDSAIPQRPGVNTLVQDVRSAAEEQGITIENFEMSTIDLKKMSDEKKVKTITITIQTNANYQSTEQFIQKIIDQKRLKTIGKLQIKKDDKTQSGSSQLHITLETDAYHL